MRLTTKIEVTLSTLVSDLDTLLTTAKFFRMEPQLRETEDGDYYERQYRTAMENLHTIRDALHEFTQYEATKGKYRKLLTYVKDLLFYQWKMDWAMRHYCEAKLYAKREQSETISTTWVQINAALSRDLTMLPIEEMIDAIA